MIRFSKKEDYSLILLASLASDFQIRLTSLSKISREYNISILFLRNLASQLRKAGFIKAKEGKNGGYYLSKDPKKIKVGEVLRTISKRQFPLDCLDKNKICPKRKICETSSSWKKISNDFINKINNLSLYEFINYK